MPVAMLTTERLADRIAAHNLGRSTFQSWTEGEATLYDVVSDDMEPGRKYFWGHCSENDSYFISDSVPTGHRVAILQMEHHRIQNKLSHLEAVRFAVRQPSNNSRVVFLQILSVFYQEEASSYEESASELDDRGLDVRATLQYISGLA